MDLLLLTNPPADRCGRPFRVRPDDRWEESSVFPLSAARTVLGRRPEALVGAVLLPHPEVDRTHACIERRPDGYHIEDLHSHNGTTVNGMSVPANTLRRLEQGDRIGILGYEFEFCRVSVT